MVTSHYAEDSEQQTAAAALEWPQESTARLQRVPSPNPATSGQAAADLAYKYNARGNSFNNPPPDGWLYPHKKGIGTGSNLEPFKAEIEARTHRGEKCKAIAAALNAMGVQTSDRAVSRVRIRWGMRKRAQRKVKTPQPDSDAARLSAKSKVQAMRKAELIRMTREGLSPEEIYRSLTSRGMDLKKGVATVLRLQSAWGVARDDKRWLGNFRHQCHKKAKAQQVDAFKDIARELGVQDVELWVQEKVREQPAREARHELALKLMGEHAPVNPERRKLQKPRKTDRPYKKRGSATGPDGRSDSRSSDGQDSDNGSPEPATDLRFGIIDSETHRKQTPGLGSSLLTTDSNYYDRGEECDGRLDDDANDSPDRAASIATRVSAHLINNMSQPTSGYQSHRSQQLRSSRETLASISPEPDLEASSPQPQLAATLKADTASSNIPFMASAFGRGHTERLLSSDLVQSSSMQAYHPPPQIHPAPNYQHQNRPEDYLSQSVEALSTQSYASTVEATASEKTVTSGLVLPLEEAEANKSALSTLDQYNAAAKGYKDLLEARNGNRPLPGSLTGMAPSSKEVEAAKRKLKEATQAMMLALD